VGWIHDGQNRVLRRADIELIEQVSEHRNLHTAQEVAELILERAIGPLYAGPLGATAQIRITLFAQALV
jgi:hypothetical protein